jgi:hypothetical protein
MHTNISLLNMVHVALILTIIAIILGSLGAVAYHKVVEDPLEDQEVGNMRINGVLQEYRNNTVNFTPTADGTSGAPSKTLTGNDSGSTYFVNTSTNTALFKLPPATSGRNFRFVQNITSDAEAVKDLIIHTADASTFIIGAGVCGGLVTDSGVTNTTLRFDGSAGGPTNAGDRIEILADGSNWYVIDASSVATAQIYSVGLA